uniref:NET domain-containing protein n=1 Tax=viral metagenome TaxID=1070528 RepID=A0A6C0KI20_9ZZZZ
MQTAQMLEQLKMRIEKMDKAHHIEILKILKQNSSITLNENKSGVYVNLSFLSETDIQNIQNYIQYIDVQEAAIDVMESQQTTFKNTYFS